jgi:hypothetical protein
LIEYFKGNDWCAKSNQSDFEFGHRNGKDPIEFDEADWAGYDEDGDESVGIYDFQSKFVVSKKK